ncbi:DUF2553 family protein [Rossellomorea sp. BNER]|uniref:DUF2553 family protein n=1 Tax=Rossellomorea sp. BNER TaxID=2962031 RepID=UPI003AF2B1CC|nr:YusG family protein [Rossellomorea sp. BNER]
MTLESKKLNVTERIVGKIKNGELQFYLDQELVGRMPLNTSEQNVQMEPNFELNGNEFVQNYMSPNQNESRYTDCDEGGWC